MAKTIVGLFDDRDAAHSAVQDLIDAGLDRGRISVVAADEDGKFQTHKVDAHGNMAAEGAVTGLASGAVVGGVIGLLVGAGFTVLPIAGLLLAGPVAGAIAGAATGAAAGGILGALIGMGIPKEHADVYAEGVRRGGTLVLVQTDTDAEEARVRDLLDRDGAVDIEERGAAYRAEGFTAYDHTAKPFTPEEARRERERWRQPAATEKLQVVEENVNVGKREVPTGGVRVRSYVTEQPVQKQVSLTEEHVDVQRRPVDRPVDPNALETFREGTIEVKERAEVPVVKKEAHVVEEVAIGKVTNERTETIQDTVRQTHVDVVPVDYDAEYWRRDFAQRHPNERYEEYEPAYRFGHELSNDAQFQSGDWTTLEPTVRQRWETRHPNSWNRFREHVRASWEGSRARNPRARMM
ncbi:MAG TPA: YsnF/AvaK domain-containing protein [Fimbriimonas sp.]